jgi:hypothetical protein
VREAVVHVLKAQTGLFDARGRFSVGGLLLLPWRLARARARAFVRGAAGGAIVHFLAVSGIGGWDNVTGGRLDLLVPVLTGDSPFVPVAMALWGLVSARFGFRRARARGGPAVAAGPLGWLATAAAAGASAAWADDGGLQELDQGLVQSGIALLAAQSGVVGFVCGLGGAFGEAVAEALHRAPAAPPDPGPAVAEPAWPVLLDPDGGEPLVVNRGEWPDVPVGHVWYGEWLSPAEAEAHVRQRREELRRRQAEIDTFWDDTQQRSEARAREREERLRREGLVYDREADAWKPGPDHPETREREAREKIRRTIAALDRLADQLPPADQLRILQSEDAILESRAPDEERTGRLERLTRAVFDRTQGRAMAQHAAAELAAERAAIREGVTRTGMQLVGMAAGGMYLAGLRGGGLLVMGANALHGGYQGYQEGGAARAALEAVRSALPVNTGLVLYRGGGPGEVALAVLQDLGNAVGLKDGARALAAVRASRAGGKSLLKSFVEKADDAAAAAGGASNPIDDAWRAERARGQRLVDEFDELRRRTAAAATPAERQALAAQLRQKAAEVNASYSAKSILKPQKGALPQALDEEVVGIYRDVDGRTMGELNDMGFRKGGRPFGSRDMVDLRNASSKGTVGMDRDVALNELNRRRLRELLERQAPGSDKAHLIQERLRRLDREAGLSIDFDRYTGHVQGRLRTLAQEGPPDALQTNRLLREIADSPDRGPALLAKVEQARAMHARLLATSPGSAATRQLGQAREMLDDLAQAQARGGRFFEKLGAARAVEQRLAQVDPRSAEGRKLVQELMEARRAASDAGRVSPSTWNEIGQRTYDRVYEATTGQNAVKSYQAFTQSRNPEAYFDLGVLRNDPVGTPFRPAWASQTASVTSFKTYHNDHLAHLGHLTRGEAIQESARGLAKDMKTKLLPLLQNDARTTDAAFQRLGRLQDVLHRVGEGKLPPGQLDGALRALYPEVPDMDLAKAVSVVTSNLQAGIQGHQPIVTVLRAAKGAAR